MNWWTVIAGVSLLLAALPAVLFCLNLRAYRPPPSPGAGVPAVSVLIPARNEEATIAAAVNAARASTGVDLEVLVLDDHSEDNTAIIVRDIAAADPRVRLMTAPPLPPDWCGKPHACALLASWATHPWLVFVDADVRLAPDALVRLVAGMMASGADLLSGVPRQETRTFLERLLVPLIHFILLGFLPLERMRRSLDPAYGAGCGQVVIARRTAYEKVGGHAAVRTSLHDGITLPRAFRAAGYRTDLMDLTELASCRMYHSAGEVWRGLGKNACEGLANPRLIVPATLVLFGGQVVPVALLAAGQFLSPATLVLATLAAGLSYWPRAAACVWFRQDILGALLHPLGVLLFLAIQWLSFGRGIRGRPAEWKGRVYTGAGAVPQHKCRECR